MHLLVLYSDKQSGYVDFESKALLISLSALNTSGLLSLHICYLKSKYSIMWTMSNMLRKHCWFLQTSLYGVCELICFCWHNSVSGSAYAVHLFCLQYRSLVIKL